MGERAHRVTNQAVPPQLGSDEAGRRQQLPTPPAMTCSAPDTLRMRRSHETASEAAAGSTARALGS